MQVIETLQVGFQRRSQIGMLCDQLIGVGENTLFHLGKVVFEDSRQSLMFLRRQRLAQKCLFPPATTHINPLR